MAEVGVPQAGVDGKRVALTRGSKAGLWGEAEVEVEAELQGMFWHTQAAGATLQIVLMHPKQCTCRLV